MHSEAWNDDRSAVFVISRIDDVLEVCTREDAAPQMRSVVTLEDVLPTVGEKAVTEQETPAAKPEIILVVFRYAVGNECGADSVVLPPPACSGVVSSEFGCAVYFCIRKRLVQAFIPA